MKKTQETELFQKTRKEVKAFRRPLAFGGFALGRKRRTFLFLTGVLLLPLASCDSGNYTVNFYVDGELVNTLTGIKNGAKIDPPSETLYKGYTVKSWYVKEGELESPWSFSGSVVSSDLDLYANFERNTYLVTFLDEAHGKSQAKKEVSYKADYDFSSVFKDDFYAVKSWTDRSGVQYPLKGKWALTGDLTLIANWDLKVFNITYVLPDGAENDASNPKSFSYDTPSFELRPAKKEGYVFQYWYDSSNNKISVINHAIHKDLILRPKFECEKYTITFVDKKNGHETASRTIGYETSYDFSDVFEDEHYSVSGWYDDDLNYYPSAGSYTFLRGMTLYADWEETRYKITYNLDGGVNDERNPDSYVISDCPRELFSPKKDCFGFQCWVDEGGNKIASLDKTTHGDLNLTAVWSDLRDLYLSSSDESKGNVEIVKGGRQNGSGSNVTVKANAKDGCAFGGWYHDGALMSVDNPYTFEMPSSNYDLKAKFVETDVQLGIKPSFDSTGSSLTYGLYPQTHVSDASLIERLNSLSVPAGNGWFFLDGYYYAKRQTNKLTLEFADGTKIKPSIVYWFKCEPIQWTVLSSSDGTHSLISTRVLDSHCFNKESSTNMNYFKSGIRLWLNAGFYNSAFYFDASIIRTHDTVYGSKYYDNLKAYDEVYLVSFENIKESDCSTSIATDWARIGGVKIHRDGTSPFWAPGVGTNPGFYNNGHDNQGNFESGDTAYCSAEYVGVRPGITVEIG